MGGSLRRLKKGKAKVKVGVKKTKKNIKAKVPQEITSFRESIEKKLGFKPDWDDEKTVTKNYAAAGFLTDANAGFGRNKGGAGAALKAAEEKAAAGEQTFDDDDELRAGCHLPRKERKKLPQRLTKRQKMIIKTLIDAHGNDVEKMVRDTKRNRMLLTGDQLKKMIASLEHWGDDNSVDFRVPIKGLMPRIK